MKDPYEHIHMATNERLAEMLEDPMPINQKEWYEIIKEAALRLRARNKAPFNYEAFNV